MNLVEVSIIADSVVTDCGIYEDGIVGQAIYDIIFTYSEFIVRCITVCFGVNNSGTDNSIVFYVVYVVATQAQAKAPLFSISTAF